MKKIWILKSCDKCVSKDIHIVDGKTAIRPNLFLIKTKHIMVITTNGCNKNYAKLIVKGNKCYYIECSITKLMQSFNHLPFLMTSKSTALNMKFVKQTLNTSYCFIDNVPYKVGKAYKNSLKEYLSSIKALQEIS